jgi:hypothetical protein
LGYFDESAVAGEAKDNEPSRSAWVGEDEKPRGPSVGDDMFDLSGQFRSNPRLNFVREQGQYG